MHSSVPEKFIPANYQQCSMTVMDNISDPFITFDEKGICNYYYQYQNDKPDYIKDRKLGTQKFNDAVKTISQARKNKTYDCILGVSGGVDSTYLALLAKRQGLRPLLVHFDNGWNSEIATKNIENIIKHTGFDLYTHVFNWEQFKEIQLSHFKADVVDIEGITDIAIWGTIVMLAVKYNTKYVLSGFNYETEKILPDYWTFKDYYNIIDIHKKMGGKKIDIFPFYDNNYLKIKARLLGIVNIPLLDYNTYNKSNAIKEIEKEFDWINYGGKHYESVFTRFYQGYILPNKFGIDKRKAHLSTLICSGQMTKQEALEELQKPIYNPELLKSDYEFVIKKLQFTTKELEDYISSPRVEHTVFDTTSQFQQRSKLISFFKKLFS